jgi:hypothetical protein
MASCKMANVGKDYPETNQSPGASDQAKPKPPVLQPERQAHMGPILSVTLDDTGKVAEKLVLRLDYFPAPRPDGVSIPSCYQQITADLVVGRLSCGASADIAIDVKAGQVTQQCYTSVPVRIIPAASALVLQGCEGSALLQSFQFKPDLKLELIK